MRHTLAWMAALAVTGLGCAEEDPLAQNEFALLQTRPIDGIGANETNPTWGATASPYVRLLDAQYADGVGESGGASRPNPRTLSNALGAQDAQQPNSRGLTTFFFAWGTYVAFDVSENRSPRDPADQEETPIAVVDPGDPFGDNEIPYIRRESVTDADGVRQQINFTTAFLDGSGVYGSHSERESALRENDGSGRLRTSAGDLLPINTEGLYVAVPPGTNPSEMFLAGSPRANNVPDLAAVHTLLVREHNFQADRLRARFPSASGDQVYQAARAIVIAEIQRITYDEWLPEVIGETLSLDSEYDETVNPGLLSLALPAFTFGQSLTPENIDLVTANGVESLPLAETVNQPDILIENGLDPVVLGMTLQVADEIDGKFVDAIRNNIPNFDFIPRIDLQAINIQRERDFGLPDYNTVREALGLSPLTSLEDFRDTSRYRDGDRIADLYTDVNDVDLVVAGQAEIPQGRSAVGETFTALIRDQFTRLRDSDNWWYRRALTADAIEEVDNTTLRDLIARHTDISEDQLSRNPFIQVGPLSLRDDFDGSDELDPSLWEVTAGTVAGVALGEGVGGSNALILGGDLTSEVQSGVLTRGECDGVRVNFRYRRGPESPDPGEVLTISIRPEDSTDPARELFSVEGLSGSAVDPDYIDQSSSTSLDAERFRVVIRVTGADGADFDKFYIDDFELSCLTLPDEVLPFAEDFDGTAPLSGLRWLAEGTDTSIEVGEGMDGTNALRVGSDTSVVRSALIQTDGCAILQLDYAFRRGPETPDAGEFLRFFIEDEAGQRTQFDAIEGLGVTEADYTQRPITGSSPGDAVRIVIEALEGSGPQTDHFFIDDLSLTCAP